MINFAFLRTSLIVSSCPKVASLSAITTKPPCLEDFGQVRGAAFQRVYKDDGTKNFFDLSTAHINTFAAWETFEDASDSAKIVSVPRFANFENEAGGVRTFGSGNQVVGGVPIILGTDATTFNGTFYRTPQSVIKEIKALHGEVGPTGGDLGVYLFNEKGWILTIYDDNSIGGSPTKAYPIPLESFLVKDLTLGGFDGPNRNDFEGSFLAGWSDDTILVVPSVGFNPLTDLGV